MPKETTNGSPAFDNSIKNVENRKRDIKVLPPVWKTANGNAPEINTKTGEYKRAPYSEMSKAEVATEYSFTLELGSKDDEGINEIDDGKGNKIPVLQCIQPVPLWALEAYRKRYGAFRNWEDERAIYISTAA